MAETTGTQVWTSWDPDNWPAPEGCYSMTSLAEDLVDTGHLEAATMSDFVGEIHDAARQRRFAMSLTMHAVIARRGELPSSAPRSDAAPPHP